MTLAKWRPQLSYRYFFLCIHHGFTGFMGFTGFKGTFGRMRGTRATRAATIQPWRGGFLY